MYRIFLVEDDEALRRSLSRELAAWGYEVRLVEDFTAVDEECLAFDPHLIIMDVTLPEQNGFTWCRILRRKINTPILFLSSASERIHVIEALSFGADDYVTKPFDMMLLEAKISALLRRSFEFSKEDSTLSVAGLSLYPEELRATYEGKSVELSAAETKSLSVLMRAAPEVVRRADLMDALWMSDVYIDDNTLSVHIRRLRQTLATIGAGDLIKTKVRVGYYVG